MICRKKSNAIERTSRGLAREMFDELELLKSGDSTPQMARAKASAANTIIAIARLEMDFARFVPSTRAIENEESGLKSLPMD